MIVGVSPAIRRALALAERYARTRLPVLLVGATGTGKELFAQHIHERSGRPGSLVDVNCCALPRDMVESLLFGHRRGAFTGAIDSAVGHLERADGGTLFLDELASLALDAQGKLLRALDTGEIQPLGAGGKRRVDLRVVSAVHEDIQSAIENGRFRRDLYQRAAGVVIELLPLAARPEDIVPLADHFAALRGRRLEPDATHVLLAYPWPGNGRELRLTIGRAGELAPNGSLDATVVAEAIALGAPLRADASPAWTKTRRRRLTAPEVRAACAANDWRAGPTAAALGVGRTTFFKLLRECGLALKRPTDRPVHAFTANVNAD